MNTNKSSIIWQLIMDLLHEHDCVILPGFGGFVCNREPARIDQISHEILPPGKRIVFNQNLKTNDGLLAGKLAIKLAVNYTSSLEFIEQIVHDLLEELTDKKQSIVDGFGSFRLNAEANYVFLPDRQNNFMYASYGLEPVHADFISSGYARIRRTKIFKERKSPATSKRRRIKNLGPKALVLTLLLMLGTNAWIYFNSHPTENLRIGTASLQISAWFDSIFNPSDDAAKIRVEPITHNAIEPLAKETVPEFVPELNLDSLKQTPNLKDTLGKQAPASEFSYNIDAFVLAYGSNQENFYIPHQPMDTIVEKEGENTNESINIEIGSEIQESIPIVKETNLYFIIGGVFCKENNAIRFREKLITEGFKAEILDNSTIHCHRVSYASYMNKTEALEALRQIQENQNPDAWIYSGKE